MQYVTCLSLYLSGLSLIPPIRMVSFFWPRIRSLIWNVARPLDREDCVWLHKQMERGRERGREATTGLSGALVSIQWVETDDAVYSGSALVVVGRCYGWLLASLMVRLLLSSL
jgi:hypothetical protein